MKSGMPWWREHLMHSNSEKWKHYLSLMQNKEMRADQRQERYHLFLYDLQNGNHAAKCTEEPGEAKWKELKPNISEARVTGLQRSEMHSAHIRSPAEVGPHVARLPSDFIFTSSKSTSTNSEWRMYRLGADGKKWSMQYIQCGPEAIMESKLKSKIVEYSEIKSIFLGKGSSALKNNVATLNRPDDLFFSIIKTNGHSLVFEAKSGQERKSLMDTLMCKLDLIDHRVVLMNSTSPQCISDSNSELNVPSPPRTQTKDTKRTEATGSNAVSERGTVRLTEDNQSEQQEHCTSDKSKSTSTAEISNSQHGEVEVQQMAKMLVSNLNKYGDAADGDVMSHPFINGKEWTLCDRQIKEMYDESSRVTMKCLALLQARAEERLEQKLSDVQEAKERFEEVKTYTKLVQQMDEYRQKELDNALQLLFDLVGKSDECV